MIGTGIPDSGGGELTATSAFMAIYFGIFLSVLAAAFLGLKFYQRRSKKRAQTMLQAIAGEPSQVETTILNQTPGEEVKPLTRLLASFHLAARAEAMIKQAGLDWKVDRLLLLMAAGGTGAALAGRFIFPALPVAARCLLAGGIGTALPYLYVQLKRRKRLTVMEGQFPEALDFLARSLRVGHAFSISMEMMGDDLPDPLGMEFRMLASEQMLGAPIEVSLRNFAERVPLMDVRFFAAAVLMQRQTGGNLSEVLTRLAFVIRDRFRLRGQVKAASAHGRLTAALLTAMPVVTMIALLAVAPGYLESLAADPLGRYLVIGCIIAQVIGNLTIRKVVRIKI